MNVQIYSNTINQEGDVNYTNKFTMTLPEPIDGENKTRYIRALNVTYPLMINNLAENTCGIRFNYTLFWNSQPSVKGDNITIETDWIYLTRGRYKKIKCNFTGIWFAFFNTSRWTCGYIYRYGANLCLSL
jgi:hypothetical protein